MNSRKIEIVRCLIARVMNIPPDNIIVKPRKVSEKYNNEDIKKYDREDMGATELSAKYNDRFEVPGSLSFNNFSEYRYTFFFSYNNIPSEEEIRSEVRKYLKIIAESFLKDNIYKEK